MAMSRHAANSTQPCMAKCAASRTAAAAASSSSFARSGPPTSAPPSASAVPGQLTGSQLAVALLTPDRFPPGFAVSATATLDSGNALTTAAPAHDPQHLTCAELITDLGRPGFGETAMATNLLFDNATGEAYSAEVYQFASSGLADVFYDDLSATWAACPVIVAAITPTETGRMAATPRTAPRGLGVQDFAMAMVGTEGRRLTQSVTVVRDGVDVYLGTAGRLGTRQPTDLDSTALLRDLIESVTELD